MPFQASTAKLRNQVEDFKKARGWSEEQFAQKTANWDTADFDELANGFIRQQTLSKRDAQLRKEVEDEKTKIATDYNSKFSELARLKTNAKDAAESGTAKAQQVANRLITEFKANAVKWAQDNELDPSKLMIATDFDSIVKQELGATSQPANNRQNGNGNNGQPQVNSQGLTNDQIQQMIDNAIGNGAGRLTAIQEKIEDYNDELGLKGRARVTFSKFQGYISENGIDPSQASVEGILDEMTDAPTKRAKMQEDDWEKRYQERHSKDMAVEIEKRFGQTLPAQMAASNIPQMPKRPIFMRNLAGDVREGQQANQGQDSNTDPNPNLNGALEHRSNVRPERTPQQRKNDVMRDIYNHASKTGT